MKTCDATKRGDKDPKENCQHFLMYDMVSHVCGCECVCVCVCLNTEESARQRQLGRPSSVLLSSINDQSGHLEKGNHQPPRPGTELKTEGSREREAEKGGVGNKALFTLGV